MIAVGDTAQPELLSPPRSELGENPRWDSTRQRLCWTDIARGIIYTYDPVTKVTTTPYHGDPVGGFTLQVDGSLLLFRAKDIAVLHPDGRVRSIIQIQNDAVERFNDAIADPQGRVFAGTIGRRPGSGGLYRVNCDGKLKLLFEGTQCSNGMGFSPLADTFYWTCTSSNCIYAFDYDQRHGTLSQRRKFYQLSISQELVDGLAVDLAGNIWSARWGGAAVVKHAPDGSVLQSIKFPTPRVTAACFGGKALKTLFVTTAMESATEATAGALFALPVRTAGVPLYASRVLLT